MEDNYDALSSLLTTYFNKFIGDMERGYQIKELVHRDGKYKVVIHSEDHNPPHFHVYSKDGSFSAKFYIENGGHYAGDVSSKEMRIVNMLYDRPDIKKKLLQVWNKRM